MEGLGRGADQVTVFINGQPRTVTGARTILELVHELELTPGTLLVEHNGLALRPAEWNSHALAERDRIELLRVAAGG